MMNTLLEYLLEVLKSSDAGSVFMFIIGILIFIIFIIIKIAQKLPKWWKNISKFFEIRAQKQDEERKFRQMIVDNNDRTEETRKVLTQLTETVQNLIFLNDKMQEEYVKEHKYVQDLTQKVGKIEQLIPEIEKRSDARDEAIIELMRKQDNQLGSISKDLKSLDDIVELLVVSDTESFRERLLRVYNKGKETNTVDMLEFTDLHKGIKRYQLEGGNCWAEDIFNEIKKFEKVHTIPNINYHEEEISEEF